MKLRWFFLPALLSVVFAAAAEDSIETMLRKADAIEDNNDDTSGAERLLTAVLERDPNHPRALWQLLYLRTFAHLGNNSDADTLPDDAETLAAAGEPLLNIVRQAQMRGEKHFAHYVMARYAEEYRAYDRALAEIDAALAIKPAAENYLFAKGRLLADKGKWEKDDKAILSGMAIIETLLGGLRDKSGKNLPAEQARYYFKLAWYNSALSRPQPEKTVEYYQAAIDKFDKHSKRDRVSLAYAWHNVSNAYAHLGRCAEAQEASANALRIMQFGAARHSLQNAAFCEEMEALAKEAEHGVER